MDASSKVAEPLITITDLLMEAKEWEATCARQPEHDVCEACQRPVKDPTPACEQKPWGGRRE